MMLDSSTHQLYNSSQALQYVGQTQCIKYFIAALQPALKATCLGFALPKFILASSGR